MKIVAIACARNEADIIEAFVRHTLFFCQQLIVLDHGSADETPEILRSLQQEGLKVHVITDPRVGNFQTAHMNQMLKMAVCEYAADWVVCLDSDEFIQGDLAEGLAQADTSRPPYCFKVPLRNYVAHPTDCSEIINPVERLRHYDLNESRHGTYVTCKVMVPGVLGRHETGFLEQGNHRFLLNGFEAPYEMLEGVLLGHFSLRLPSQYAAKLVSKTLQKYRQVAARTHNEDFYERPYRELRQSYTAFVSAFPNARLSWSPKQNNENLIADPIDYKGMALRYTPSNVDTDQLIKQILDLTENLARTATYAPESVIKNDTATPTFISISSDSAAEGRSVQKQLQVADSGFVSLVFPLENLGECNSLLLGASTDPCILEIDSITLAFSGKEPYIRSFDANELKSMIQEQEMGVIIDSAGSIRVLVSHLPMHLKFQGWRNEQEPMPFQATIKLRCVRSPQELVSIILAPNVIGKIVPAARLQMHIQNFQKHIQNLQKELKEANKKLQKICRRPLKFLLRSWKQRLLGCPITDLEKIL